MKLWQKDKASLVEVEKFTVGKDNELDIHLAPFDVLGSLAHTKMLESVGLLTKEELSLLEAELKNIYQQVLVQHIKLPQVNQTPHKSRNYKFYKTVQYRQL